MVEVLVAWNNGKSGAKLDLTSSTTPRTANPCDWLPCRRAPLLLISCPHSLVYLHLPVVEGLIFCISATPHLGTPSHYSMLVLALLAIVGDTMCVQDLLARDTQYRNELKIQLEEKMKKAEKRRKQNETDKLLSITEARR